MTGDSVNRHNEKKFDKERSHRKIIIAVVLLLLTWQLVDGYDNLQAIFGLHFSSESNLSTHIAITSSLIRKNSVVVNKALHSDRKQERGALSPNFSLTKGRKTSGASKVFPLENLKKSDKKELNSDQTDENHPPVAVPGPDFVSSLEGQDHLLDARNSYDPDGDELQFSWYVAKSPPGGRTWLQDPHSPVTRFSVDEEGCYWFGLIVNDGKVRSRPALIKVTIQDKNLSPVAIITGPDRSAPKQKIVLSGENSFDPENDPLSFQWKLESTPAKSLLQLNNTSSKVLELLPDLSGKYQISLVVSDGKSQSPPQSHQIEVNSHFNSSIELIVDEDQEILVGQTQTLRAQVVGTNDSIDYQIWWQTVSVPEGSHARIYQLGSSVDVRPDVPGHYLVRASLQINGNTITHKTVHLSALLAQKSPRKEAGDKSDPLSDTPQHVFADAGPDMVKCLGARMVPLQSKNSYSTFSNELDYYWEIRETPIGSRAAYLAHPREPATDFIPDLPGKYIIFLRVKDRLNGDFSSARLQVRMLRDQMEFEVKTGRRKWPSPIEKESRPEWYGIKVYYGPHRSLVQKVNKLRDSEGREINSDEPNWKVESNDFYRRIGLPGPPLAWDYLPLGEAQMMFSSDYNVHLTDPFLLGIPYYFTYAYWHQYLGAASEEIAMPLYQFTKRRIDGLECYQIEKVSP